MLVDEIKKTEIFDAVIITAQTVGALGAGLREEKDKYCPVWSSGCCGQLEETLLQPTGIKGRTLRPKHRPPPPHSDCSRLCFLSDQESNGLDLQF